MDVGTFIACSHCLDHRCCTAKMAAGRATSGCEFLRDDGCAIHSFRPVECKLFPYVVVLSNNRYMLIRTEDCPENTNNYWGQDGEVDYVLSMVRGVFRDKAKSLAEFRNTKYHVVCEIDPNTGRRKQD